MKFESSTEQDIPQLQRWIDADLYHKNLFDPAWWLTGNGLLSYVVHDSEGPIMYARLDQEGSLARLYCQFAPESEVPKIRLVKGLLKTIPVIAEYCKQRHIEGIVFRSTSPTLIAFGRRVFEFKPLDKDDDYVLYFKLGDAAQ